MKTISRIMFMSLMIITVIASSGVHKIGASNTNKKDEYISKRAFVDQIGSKLGLELDETNSYKKAAIKVGIILEEEEWENQEFITKEEVALLIHRAEVYLNGKKYNKDQYDNIIKYNRIKDFMKISKDKQDAVIKVYMKGIMIGSSNGPYSSDRTFEGNSYFTMNEAKKVVKRLVLKNKRRSISPDGQLIRVTKLPRNYKDFPYILESYPNAYYERSFDYELYVGKFKEYKDYVRPVNIKKVSFVTWDNTYKMEEILDAYLDSWVLQVKNNLTQRFNVNYKTIDKSNNWLNKTRNTYFLYNDASSDESRTKDIKEYISKVKKNKTIIKGIVRLDKSSVYKSVTGYYLRAYVKFKIVSAKTIPSVQNNLIYGRSVYIKNLKKGKWIEKYFDIGLGSCNACSDGGDFAVVEDNIVDELFP